MQLHLHLLRPQICSVSMPNQPLNPNLFYLFITIFIIIIIILSCISLPYRICSTILSQHTTILYHKPVWNSTDKLSLQLDFFDLTFTTERQVANRKCSFAWLNDAHWRDHQNGNASPLWGRALQKITSNTSAYFLTALFSRSAPRINRNSWEITYTTRFVVLYLRRGHANLLYIVQV